MDGGEDTGQGEEGEKFGEERDRPGGGRGEVWLGGGGGDRTRDGRGEGLRGEETGQGMGGETGQGMGGEQGGGGDSC